MRDITYLERELLRIRRENENNIKTASHLKEQIQELQSLVLKLQTLLGDAGIQVKND